MIGYIIGAILIVGGALMAWLIPRRLKNKILEIKFMKTTPIGELKAILTDNAKAGLEGYRHYVELKGKAGSDKTVKAPYSEKKVAYYDAKLYQVYEERRTYRDDNGVTHESMVRNESLLSDQKSSDTITIKNEDSADKVYVNPSQSGLRFDTMKTLDRFEPVNNMKNYSFFSGFNYRSMGARTLGFRMIENTIPLDHTLYLLGEAWLEGSRIAFGRPRDAKKPSLLSAKSEAEIIKSNKTKVNLAIVFGILVIVGGILIMIFIR